MTDIERILICAVWIVVMTICCVILIATTPKK